MVGVVIVTHLDIGEKMLKAAEMISGQQERCVAVSLDIHRGMDETLAEIKKAVQDTDNGSGVLILTDMFGGTPSNLSLSLMGDCKEEGLEVITGVSLPMLLKILGSRTLSLKQLASEAKAAGRQGILIAGEVLRRKVGNG
jgi:PTS system mannose-specific IIA component